MLAGLVSHPDPYISTPADPWIPNLVHDSSFRSECGGTCFWDSASSWSTGRIPDAGDRVIIDPGDEVVIRNQQATAGVIAVDEGGKLRFDPAVDTDLDVVTLLVLGELEIGTAADPIADDVMAGITFRDVAIDLAEDPGQYGNGFLALENSKVRIHGRTLNETFVRLSQEPRAGETTLTLNDAPTGWKIGDEILLPDTRHLRWNQLPKDGNYVPQWEELTIAGISGNTITLSSALQFDHLGARDADNNLDFLPHVVNRSRNVTLQSANPDGTRGHTLFQGRSDIDVRYAAFQHLGRTKNIPVDSTTWDAQGKPIHVGTNQIARYAIHTHHLVGPSTPQANGQQFTLIGNSVDNGSATHNNKWAVAIHGSHYGLIKQNTAYNIAGAAFVTEDGTESYNVFERNFVMRSYSVGSGYRYSVEAGSFHSAREATGFWFRGPNNYVRGNVATNITTFDQVESAYGFKYLHLLLGSVMIPATQGAMPMVDGVPVNMNKQAILEFSDNEVYGATEGGLTYWWVGMHNNSPLDVSGTSLIENLHIWHTYNRGIYAYHSNEVTIDGLVVRGHDPRLSAFGAIGYESFDYPQREAEFRNVDIQNMNVGIRLSTNPFDSLIKDSVLRNASVNITVNTPQSCCGFTGQVPARAEIRNVRFGPVAGSSTTAQTIRMRYNQGGNLVELNEAYVYDYNGVPGDDFQLYYLEQDPDFIVPQSTPTLIASPVAGLSNQENWDTYGIAIAGGLSPTRLERDGIHGYVGPVTDQSNRPPFATSDSFTLTVNREDQISGQLLSNDFDVDNDALSVIKVNGNSANVDAALAGNYGSIAISADGTFRYTLDRSHPDVLAIALGDTLVDSFLTTISDGEHVDSATLDVLVRRTGVVVPFLASDDNGSIVNTVANTNGNVLSNDSSPLGTISVVAVNDDAAAIGQTVGGVYGTLQLNANGTFLYALDIAHPEVSALAPNQVIRDDFAYTMSDGVQTGTANLGIRIAGNVFNNSAPVAVPDELQVSENGATTSIVGNILENDSDPDGDPVFVTRLNALWNIVGVKARYRFGDFVLFRDGSFEYQLDESLAVVDALGDGEFLIEAFTYSVSDGDKESPSHILITINGVEDALLPQAEDDLRSIFEDDVVSTVVGNVLANDRVPSGDIPTIASVDGSADNIGQDISGKFGTWHINVDGSFVYALDNDNPQVDGLDNGQELADSVSYQMSDTRGTSHASLTVSINGVRDNVAPVASPDFARIDSNATTAANGNLLVNDDDEDDETLTVTDVNGRLVSRGTSIAGVYGHLQIDSDGSFSYQVDTTHPDVLALQVGETLIEGFAYTVSDGLTGAANLLTVTIDGRRSNAPVAGDSNGDGVFNSSDLILVFQAGEYEDAIVGNSTFAEGDWNGDGDFDSADIIYAFQQGTYAGARAADDRGLRAVALDQVFADL